MGLAEGEKKRSFQIAKQMLADGEQIEKIVRYTGLSAEEVQALRVLR